MAIELSCVVEVMWHTAVDLQWLIAILWIVWLGLVLWFAMNFSTCYLFVCDWLGKKCALKYRIYIEYYSLQKKKKHKHVYKDFNFKLKKGFYFFINSSLFNINDQDSTNIFFRIVWLLSQLLLVTMLSL